ncbi:MAG: glutaminase A [Verrucomicrobiales bacterium]|nr:glutaminase A [Verrucomicrobiales bacterium]
MNSPPAEPHPSPILDYISDLHRDIAKIQDGSLATYIPELARANPNWFGLCVVTAAGSVYEAGDSRVPFTIQSISKPFVYGLALEDNTRAEVLAKIGVEPTGDAFNAISLEPGTGRPRNPMINAGAIAAAGLIAGKSPATRFSRILESFSLYAGRELSMDEAVYRSEAETGHRNRAIGHMLRNFNILTEPPEPVVDLYFKQCSVSVTCRDLGVMAATLANQGVNPLTQKQAIRGEYVESVISVMASCGMYDYAGEWLYRIGMPAKSGVAGGVIAVLPGQLGIGVFSPLLDARGNSVRGIKVCDSLSRSLDLHLFNTPHASQSVIRLRFNGSQVNSSRQRPSEESRLLRESGGSIRVYQLQGNLVFSTCEVVVRQVLDSTDADGLEYLVLDLKHVLDIDECASRLLYQLGVELRARGKTILFSRSARLTRLRRYMKLKLGDRFEADYRVFDDNDTALEWCENRWLGARLPGRADIIPMTVESYDLLRGLTPEEVERLAKVLQHRRYRKSELIVEIGAEAHEIYFLFRGTATVLLKLASGAQKRLGVYAPGMAFGEVGMLDRAPRSATVVAETEVECHILKREDFDALGESHPRIKITLLTNMALGIARLLRKATREMSIFDY